MAKRKGEEADSVEIENAEQWGLMEKSKDICIVDVYAEWAGPCTCLLACYKKLLLTNCDVLEAAAAAEGKGIRFYTVCAEKFPENESLIARAGNPAPHLQFIKDGEVKGTVDGADAPKIDKIVGELLEGFVAE